MAIEMGILKDVTYTNRRCENCGTGASPKKSDLKPAPYTTRISMLGWTCLCGYWNRLDPDELRIGNNKYTPISICPECMQTIDPLKWHHCIDLIPNEAKVELGLWIFNHLGEISERMENLQKAVKTRRWGVVSLIIRQPPKETI